MEQLSPMMQQYLDIKSRHEDHILFFRLGDFYEMFFDDAKLASKELELTLTGRDCGREERAPMCGVPYHSCDAYISRLIEKGYKVAICEQLEDPATAKGIVKRDVVRVITPGTIIESNMLDEGSNNFLASVYLEGNNCGIAFADISTGEIHLTEITENTITKLKNELGRFAPREVLYNETVANSKDLVDFIANKLSSSTDKRSSENYDYNTCKEIILKHFEKEKLSDLSMDEKPMMVGALGCLLSYLYATQRHGLNCLVMLNFYSDNQYMNLDIIARRNLEVTQTLRGKEKRGSLLWVIDRTKTAMGKRLLKSYLEKPLINPTIINKRLNAVSELYDNNMLLSDLSDILSNIFDLERLMTRIVFGNVTPRELKSFEYTTQHIPALKQRLCAVCSQYLIEIYNSLDTLEDLCALIQEAISEEPPLTFKDGGIIKEGYNEELDKLRDIVTNSKTYIAQIQVNERERTGIKNLKIGYNKVFGYYLEVTNSYKEMVPPEYIRKQTLTGGERYITQELKELEETIITAAGKINSLETRLYDDLRQHIGQELHRVQRTANAIAQLDAYCSFAKTSLEHNYSKPNVDLSGSISIKEGRHPVVEAIMQDTLFVSNDTDLNLDEKQIAIITGPNMAGKSTYMRQTALIVLLAQIGCFVPAKAATIGVVDGIYTRVGASDDLSSGQSTFMVEMSEVANILNNATSRSLLILDEIGRGTSTYDGMSIARAVIEYISNKRKLGAKTMFATHYHELTELENQLSGVKNYNIAVKKKGDDIIFLRRIIPGAADDSYGIYVSKLAGISDEIVNRAKQILASLEAGTPVSVKGKKTYRFEEDAPVQLLFQQNEDSELIRRIREIDVDNLKPIQALNLLSELKGLI